MKNLFALIAILAVSVPALAAGPVGRGRASMSGQMGARMAATKNNTSDVKDKTTTGDKSQVEEQKDMREREKAACMQNNIGVGATFVWASKYSNTSDYNLMREDVENPENNVCFVKVDLKSNDARVDVADIEPRYFAMGDTITCGQWVNKEDLRQRILDAKKSGRTWATIGGAVGGAGIGVGAMELFGNELIGGAVEGQANKDLSSTELLCSQMKELKNTETSKYDEIKNLVTSLDENCSSIEEEDQPDGCKKYDYAVLKGC